MTRFLSFAALAVLPFALPVTAQVPTAPAPSAGGRVFTPMPVPPGPLLTPSRNADGPLPSLVAVTLQPVNFYPDLPTLLRLRTDQYARNTLPPGVTFPLPNTTDDELRVLPELQSNVVVSWLDPIGPGDDFEAPRFGGNCDYTAYFGYGWDWDWVGGVVGSPPQFQGHPQVGLIWVNHEYVSNALPTATSAPNGQMLTFAKYLKRAGYLTNDVTANDWKKSDLDKFDRALKREYGGSAFFVWQDSLSNRWYLVRSDLSRRYDATARTQLRLTGYRSKAIDHDDLGDDLPGDVVIGLLGDCSGGQTPWGTVITAEENVQDYYGDLETAWSSAQKFLVHSGFDAGSVLRPEFAPSRSADLGRLGNVTARHNRDHYGFLAEIDLGVGAERYYTSVQAPGGDGLGHRKLGVLGRARWENATIATDGDFELMPGQPVVIYGGDDRRSGRIFKWVSKQAYQAGMTRGQVRALLDEGSLYVAHFDGIDHASGILMQATGQPPSEAQPGTGRWIHLSVEGTDVAPNASGLGKPGTRVGEALRDPEWNGICAFPTDNDVKRALFTACNKLGIVELNRPEDIEWNPRDPSGTARLYVAFTNHNQQVACDQNGVLYDPGTHATRSPRRTDTTGSIFALEESVPSDLRRSTTFRFWSVWLGTRGKGTFDAADPDNLMIGRNGEVYFGTDGNVGTNGTADAIYYLDLDPEHKAGRPGIVNPTYGKALRFVATPSDAEATGPAFNSSQSTLFFNVQHPGEDFVRYPSTWPHGR